MKKEKGITLIALVLTVMILSILVGIATYTGIDTIKSSKFTRFETELKMMQTKVNEWYEEYKNGDNTYLTLGQEISANSDVEDQSNRVFTSNASGITDKEGYRYFSIETLKTLGIEGIEKPYFINIEKRMVVRYEGFSYEGKMYYSLNDIEDGLYNVEYSGNEGKPTFDVSYEKQEDGKYLVKITNIKYQGNINKWYVKYKKEGSDSWSNTEDLEFIVNETGKYIIRVYNGDVAGEQEIKIGEETISKTESYIGWYADLNDDGEITLEEDGIIYADLAIGGSGQWYNSVGAYTIPKKENVKEYKIISETTTVDPFDTGKGIIQLAEESNAENRFYAMALKDIDSDYYYWYKNAYENMTDYQTTTSKYFGTGKSNTEAMIAKWDAGSNRRIWRTRF